MNFNTESLRALDARYFFNGLENLALIVLVIIFANALLNSKKDWLPRKLKNIAWLFVVILAISIAGQYIADLYNYFHAVRPVYEQARHSTTGL